MHKVTKKLLLLTAFLLLLPAAGSLRAQDPYRDARTCTVGLRLDGGTSWSFGSSFENVGANEVNLIQPYVGAGLIFNIRPWVRIGADYSYTRMIREQLYTSLQPVTGTGVAAGHVYFLPDFHDDVFWSNRERCFGNTVRAVSD